MRDNFFSFLLQTAETRVANSKQSSRFLLDKNEQSDDIDINLKKKVLDSLLHANWNRYPASDYKDIECKVAEYCGLQAENIVLSAGSASIITTLLDFFALNNKNIIITQPSYSLFDYHCKTYNITYQPWLLSEDLEYDLQKLPKLDSNSVLIITSPNNPVGNTIDINQLEHLLISNPESMFIVDGAYCEFSETDYTPLIEKYENLIILRSFSKAFPIAGLRLGYLCASAKIASIIKKLVLQFSITHFSLIFAREMLFNPEFMENAKMRVRTIISERERMYQMIQNEFDSTSIQVFKSHGNFLLMRIFDDQIFENLMSHLTNTGIKILRTSSFTLLQNTFRVSIGNKQENETFLNCLSKVLKSSTQELPKLSFDAMKWSMEYPNQMTTLATA